MYTRSCCECDKDVSFGCEAEVDSEMQINNNRDHLERADDNVRLCDVTRQSRDIIKARGYVAYVFYFLKDTHVR